MTGNLTQLQQIALEGELATAYSTAVHDQEVLYRFYSMLKRVPKDVAPYIAEATYELLELNRRDLDRIVLEVSMDVTPLWIWIDRVIADVKASIDLTTPESTKLSLNKRDLRKKVIKSAFVLFCRKMAMISPTAVIQLCQTIIDKENLKLDFLEDACFVLIPEVRELKQDKKVSEEIMRMSFDIRDILSFRTETEVLEELNKVSKKKSKRSKKKEDKDDTIPKKEVYRRTEKSKKGDVKYVVTKTYKESNITKAVGSFDSLKEAEAFVEEVIKNISDIEGSFVFEISKAKVRRNDGRKEL